MPAEPPLEELERFVRNAVVARGDGAPPEADDLLVPLPGLTAEQQLGIYRDGWFSRLRGALAEDFPGLEHVLGHHGFDHLVGDYVRAHPSSFTNICLVGRAMESYLASRDDLEHGPFLVELARLEWAITSVFDHPDVAVLRPEDLEGVDGAALAGARFTAAETSRVFRFDHPAGTWLRELRDGGAPAVPGPRAETVTVSRAGATVHWGAVPESVVPVLAALMEGATVEEAVIRGTEGIDDAEAVGALVQVVRESFAGWVAGGLFGEIALG